jgi:hypothetical protein
MTGVCALDYDVVTHLGGSCYICLWLLLREFTGSVAVVQHSGSCSALICLCEPAESGVTAHCLCCPAELEQSACYGWLWLLIA